MLISLEIEFKDILFNFIQKLDGQEFLKKGRILLKTKPIQFTLTEYKINVFFRLTFQKNVVLTITLKVIVILAKI